MNIETGVLYIGNWSSRVVVTGDSDSVKAEATITTWLEQVIQLRKLGNEVCLFLCRYPDKENYTRFLPDKWQESEVIWESVVKGD